MIALAILLVALCVGSSTSQQFYYSFQDQDSYNKPLQRSGVETPSAFPAFPAAYHIPYPYGFPVWGYAPAEESGDDEVLARTKKLKLKLAKPFLVKAAALNALKGGSLLGFAGAPLTLPAIIPANLLPFSASIAFSQQPVTVQGLAVTTSTTTGGQTNQQQLVLPG